MRPGVLAGALLALSGCFNFPSETLVVDRRILGMAAQPPEVIYGVSDLSQPIQVSALVVDPKDPGVPQTFTWSWCLPDLDAGFDTSTGRCIEEPGTQVSTGAVPLADLAASFPPETAVSSILAFLGSGSLTGDLNSITAELGGLNGQPLPSVSGLPTDDAWTDILFQLQVEGDADSKGPLYGVTRAVLSTPGPGDRQPNANPELTALTFDDQLWEPGVPFTLQLKQCTAANQTVVADPAKGSNATAVVCQHRIFPVFDPSQAQIYQVQTYTEEADGGYEVLTLQELLTFNWFSNAGSFTAVFTGSQSNLAPQVYDPYSNYWIEPPEITNPIVTFWITMQDDRGGESWTERQVLLTE